MHIEKLMEACIAIIVINGKLVANRQDSISKTIYNENLYVCAERNSLLALFSSFGLDGGETQWWNVGRRKRGI